MIWPPPRKRSFREIRGELATKEELKESKTEILRAIEALDVHLSAFASHANDDVTILNGSVLEPDSRVRLLEERMSFRP